MFYAIIYSLLLGFGITLGAAIYGWIDKGATSATTCPTRLSPYWNFLFVPLFTTGLALVNQASVRQLPAMITISGAGYAATYFANKKLSNATELTSAIGAFVIGILGNLYSRMGHGLAFAAMLPGIFVQVPSGVAAQGSLISGIASADSIVTNATSLNATATTTTNTISSTSLDSNGNNSFSSDATAVAAAAAATTSNPVISLQSLSVGITMIQISIGISVGLFVSTLVVYPFGKKKSGLFTF